MKTFDQRCNYSIVPQFDYSNPAGFLSRVSAKPPSDDKNWQLITSVPVTANAGYKMIDFAAVVLLQISKCQHDSMTIEEALRLCREIASEHGFTESQTIIIHYWQREIPPAENIT